MDGRKGVALMRVNIHGGQVDVLCACGHPKMTSEPLRYGFRLHFDCADCAVHFALDVIE